MKLVDKYLLREYLTALAYCLFAFCMIQVIYDLFDHLSKFMDAKTPASQIAIYYLFSLTPTLEYLLPACLLLATLYTLWHLTRNNELTAMRASGVSLYRIMLPFLAVGLFFSVLTIGLKEFITPRAAIWSNTFRDNKFMPPEEAIVYRQTHYFNSEARRLWEIAKQDVNHPSRIENVTVKEERENSTARRMINTPRAEHLDGHWWFFGGTIQTCNEDGVPIADSITPITDQGLEMPDFKETPEDFVNEQRPWEFLSSAEMIRYLASHPRLPPKDVASRRTDLHNRMAVPWICFVVVLLGIPAGARGGRHSAVTGVFYAVGLFFAFYAFNQLGVFLAKKEILLPWLGAWISNILFGLTGIIMVFRMR